jgi:hypothetical protein
MKQINFSKTPHLKLKGGSPVVVRYASFNLKYLLLIQKTPILT